MNTAQLISHLVPCLYTEQELNALGTNHHQNNKNHAKFSRFDDHQSMTTDIVTKKKTPELRYTINWNFMKGAEEPHKHEHEDDTTTTTATVEVKSLLQSTFVQSWLDEESENWLISKSNPSSLRQFASDVLYQFFGRTSANGLTFRGEMFVFSKLILSRLFQMRNDPEGFRREQDKNHRQHHSMNNKNGSVVVSGRYNLTVVDPSPSSVKLMVDDDENENVSTPQFDGSSKIASQNTAVESFFVKYPTDSRNILSRSYRTAEQQKQQHDHDETEQGRQKFSTLLDIGAGDGGVTKVLAPMFKSIYTTEDNPIMRLRLKNTFGLNSCFASEETDDLLLKTASSSSNLSNSKNNISFDMISLLNVLDRCDKPWTLLENIHRHLMSMKKQGGEINEASSSLSSSGLLLLAVVLPWCPFVEKGSQQVKPSETLPMSGGGLCRERASFEASVEKLVSNVLIPIGFKVRAWTRVPYLCEGDSAYDYYCLDDALFLLEV